MNGPTEDRGVTRTSEVRFRDRLRMRPGAREVRAIDIVHLLSRGPIPDISGETRVVQTRGLPPVPIEPLSYDTNNEPRPVVAQGAIPYWLDLSPDWPSTTTAAAPRMTLL